MYENYNTYIKARVLPRLDAQILHIKNPKASCVKKEKNVVDSQSVL